MAAPSYEALGILNLLFLLIGVLILLAVNTYVVWQWRHPEDRNEWFSAKLVVVLLYAILREPAWWREEP